MTQQPEQAGETGPGQPDRSGAAGPPGAAREPQSGEPRETAAPPPETAAPSPAAAVPPREGAAPPPEAGAPPREGAVPPREGAAPPPEAGAPPREGAVPPREAGAPPPAAAVPPRENAAPPPAAAVPPPQSAPRQSAPRQSAPRPSAPRQSAPRQSAPRQSAPRQSAPRQSVQPRQLGADLAGEVQRWLIRSGARSVRREFGEQVRRTLGGGREEPTDVWGAATTEPPPDESLDSPECAWCPICRGARRIRESGPGLGSQLAGAGDAVASAVQEALAAFDAVLSTGPGSATGKRRPASPDPAGSSRQQPRSGGHAAGPAGQAGAAHPRPTEQESSGEGPDREPDDRR